MPRPTVSVTCPICGNCRLIQTSSLARARQARVPHRCHPCGIRAAHGPRPGPDCRRCGHRPVTRPAGLCHSCYYTPGVREQWASASKFARRGRADFCGAAAPPQPTSALPGTAAKIAVMAARAAAGQAIFHPADATRADPGIPTALLTGLLA